MATQTRFFRIPPVIATCGDPAMLQSLTMAAGAIARLPSDGRKLVAVDGVDGAGKTTFADAVVPLIDRPVVRASVDDFHHPRAGRYRRVRDSPEGVYSDPFDLPNLAARLLVPFAFGDRFCRRTFDHEANRPVEPEFEDAPGDAVLLLDGLFLHRPRLRHWWDLSILLDVDEDEAARRLALRDRTQARRRYVEGRRLHFADAEPARHASLVLPW